MFRAMIRKTAMFALGALTLVGGPAVMMLGAAPADAIGGTKVRLVTWFSPSRGDYLTTTNPAWNNCLSCVRAPDYRSVGIEGFVVSPSSARPAGTVPLYHWYNHARGDNFLTTDPAWAGTVGTVRSGYTLFRIEGYVSTTRVVSTRPLQSWYSPSRQDNAASAGRAWGRQFPPATIPGTDYVRYRTEGFIEMPNLSVREFEVLGAGSAISGGGWRVPVWITVRNVGSVPAYVTPFFLVSADTGGVHRPLFYNSGTGVANHLNQWVKVTSAIGAGGNRSFGAYVIFPARPATGTVITVTADSCADDDLAPTYCRVLESGESNNQGDALTR
jgi:hypothetical protein